MFTIQKNISLLPYNTFGIDATARYFTCFSSVAEARELLGNEEIRISNKLFLGGGSNILLTQDFDGYVLQNKIEGIEKVNETDEHIFVKAGAGVVWHQFVIYCIENNYAGVENLSLIPGTVGAAPMQNIGAYGVEIKDVFYELEALHIESLEIHRFGLEACKFGYRESIFKHEAKGQYVILNVTFRLNKAPNFHVEYGAIKDTLTENGITDLTIKAISDAVIQIRQSKLPNPAEIGNAGSFFKNPEISKTQFDELKAHFPTIPSYPINETTVKVPAGWLIEQAGWKGKRIGNIGVHTKQALVLVNYGGGNGNDIKQLAMDIQASVFEKFKIKINPEVNFI